MKKQFTLKTTDEVIKKLKIAALNEGRNANEIIEEALELYYQSKKG